MGDAPGAGAEPAGEQAAGPASPGPADGAKPARSAPAPLDDAGPAAFSTPEPPGGSNPLAPFLARLPLSPEDELAAEWALAAAPDLAAVGLAPPAPPRLPEGYRALPPAERLAAAQAFISALQYNYTRAQYFDIDKDRPLASLLATARSIARGPLPIKCVEAVFLGLLLTQGQQDLERVPISFKTTVDAQVYRHIALLVRDRASGLWGALAISRKPDLGYKPLTFESAAAVIADYKACYERWWHTVRLAYVGLPVPHEADTPVPVCWRYVCVRIDGRAWAGSRAAIDGHVSKMPELWERWKINGRAPLSGLEDSSFSAGTAPAAAPEPAAAGGAAGERAASGREAGGRGRGGPTAAAAAPPAGGPAKPWLVARAARAAAAAGGAPRAPQSLGDKPTALQLPPNGREGGIVVLVAGGGRPRGPLEDSEAADAAGDAPAPSEAQAAEEAARREAERASLGA